MDFELTDEQRLIQDTVRDFVDRKVLPNAVENDIEHRLDMSVIEGMAELGLLGIVIPEEYGGAGLDFVSEALSCEEIERGEAAFRTLISVHVGLNSLSLLRYGSEEQKQRYLVPQARGEKLACFGLTEPAAGSDVASMKTTARREGDTYLLNGSKNWISYASVADHQLVFAKTDPAAKHKGISAFIVERGWNGVSTRDTENKLGIWAGSTGELFFENVEVPAENLLGEEGQGFEIAMYGLDQGRFTVAAGACGVVRACLERSVEYARERETFGQPIGKYQFVQDMIADMVLGYETSKLLVMQAAWMKNEGRRNTRETSLAKWHATESAFKAAHLAIQVHGAYGYSAEYGIERYFRNARAPIIYEGTTQIHKMMQAEHALGFRQAERAGRRRLAARLVGAGALGRAPGRRSSADRGVALEIRLSVNRRGEWALLASPNARGTHEDPTEHHAAPAAGHRADRRGVLERGGRRAAGHLTANGQGTLRCASAEARRRPASADPGRLPAPHRGRPTFPKPRAGLHRLGGLTAPRLRPGTQARTPFRTVAIGQRAV